MYNIYHTNSTIDVKYAGIASRWISNFLAVRQLVEPNGLLFYTYQITKNEYEDMKQILREYCEQLTLKDLFNNNALFRIFVLFASEWWKREYSGGSWAWEPIYRDFTDQVIDPGLFSYQSKAITKALIYWKCSITDHAGKYYLGAIIANGGIPARFIQDQTKYNSTIFVLKSSLYYANTYNPTRADLYEYVVGLASQKVPMPLRKSEIYELFTDTVLTISDLKKRYDLDKKIDPIQTLNNEEPDWKLQFPFLLEDESIEKMLAGFVMEASKTPSMNVNAKIPYIKRILEKNDYDDYEFKFKIEIPDIVEAGYFAKYYGVSNINELPQSFYIESTGKNNCIIARVMSVLGSSNKFKIRITKNSLPITNSVISCLASQDNSLHGLNVQLCDDIDIELPLVFIEQDDESLCLKGNGTTSVHEDYCYVGLKDDCDISNYNLKYTNKTFEIDDTLFKLYKVESDICILGCDIKLKQVCESKQYFFDGNCLEYITSPYRVFRGQPTLCYIDNDHEKYKILSKDILIKVHGTDRIVRDTSSYSGIVDFYYYANRNTIQYKKTIVLLPLNAKIDFANIDGRSGKIFFNNFNCRNIALLSPQTCDFLNIESDVIRINNNQGNVPKEITCSLLFQDSNKSINVILPFPCEGVKIFNEKNELINNTTISLSHLFGKRIQITYLQLKGTFYTLVLKLNSGNEQTDSKLLEYRKNIYITTQFTEIRLQDFYENIQELISYATTQSDFIECKLLHGDDIVAKIYISHYDVKLNKMDNVLCIDGSDYAKYKNIDWSKISLKAIDLLNENVEPITIPSLSLGTTCCFPIRSFLQNDLFTIFNDPESDIIIKPITILDNKILSGTSSLIQCITNNTDLSANDILKEACNDFSHPFWNAIKVLANKFFDNKVSFLALPIWRDIANNSKLLCCFLLISDFEILKKMKTELSILCESIPYKTWSDKITIYRDYIKQLYSEYDDSIIEKIFKQKLEDICELFPSHVFVITRLFLGLEMLSFSDVAQKLQECSQNLPEELADKIYKSIDMEDEENRLNGEMGILQKLLCQNSLTSGEKWISLPFRELYKNIASDQKYQDVLKRCNKYLFRFNKYSEIIEGVVNFPILCAVYNCCDTNTKWLTPQYKLSIKSFLNFNSNYYTDVYRITSEIIYLTAEERK